MHKIYVNHARVGNLQLVRHRTNYGEIFFQRWARKETGLCWISEWSGILLEPDLAPCKLFLGSYVHWYLVSRHHSYSCSSCNE
jgi:hypothetical protein